MPSQSLHKNNIKGNGGINPPGFKSRLQNIQIHFERFLWDILGLFCIAIALITLLGIFGLSKGTIITLWIDLLMKGLGWGSIIIVGLIIILGIYYFRRAKNKLPVNWGQVIGVEFASFLTLALLSLASGNQLSTAEQGKWGGQIGWGIASMVTKVLGALWGSITIIILWFFSMLFAFGLWKYIERWIMQQAGEVDKNYIETISLHSNSRIPTIDAPVVLPLFTNQSHSKKKEINRNLPSEFQKHFKVDRKEENSSHIIKPRSELLPPLNILQGEQSSNPDERGINQTAGMIEKTLSEFGIPAKVVGFRNGPTVTQFAIQPGFIRKGIEEDAQQMKVRIAQIEGLQKDLALALSAERLRIEAPVPGHSYVGIEVPNSKLHLVRLRPVIESQEFQRINSPLAIALGRDVSGNPLVTDLSRMPHLLIAGTTGSGKSVCITSMITCLAMNNTPDELRLVLIDSKMVELIRFNGLPHLYGKVETNVQRIMGVLRWVVVEMEHRYKLLEAAQARDIDAYNRKLHRRKDGQPLPRIVIMIDELADLMISAPDQTEHNLVRLAQMARATGIHLVVATQRPSTDVVTGLIKANFPARLAFSVASGVDSRVILDLPGAETLLGRGDMLFLNPEMGSLIRGQGIIVSDQEIERLIAHWQNLSPVQSVSPPWETMVNVSTERSGDEVLIEKAILLLKKERRASASLLQRRLNIGYPRAARLLDQLEEMGIIGSVTGGGRDREVLLNLDELDGEDEE